MIDITSNVAYTDTKKELVTLERGEDGPLEEDWDNVHIAYQCMYKIKRKDIPDGIKVINPDQIDKLKYGDIFMTKQES